MATDDEDEDEDGVGDGVGDGDGDFDGNDVDGDGGGDDVDDGSDGRVVSESWARSDTSSLSQNGTLDLDPEEPGSDGASKRPNW